MALLSLAALLSTSYLNVFGETLQKCSHTGMALTGFTRSGECVEINEDDGSHHICIDLSSTDGGNFCHVTGQPDWCSSSMPCDGGAGGSCPVKQWCVCQWAFASYIKNAGGCDKIQKLVCESTDMAALEAYRRQAPSSPHIADALSCLESRCNLSAGATISQESKQVRPASAQMHALHVEPASIESSALTASSSTPLASSSAPALAVVLPIGVAALFLIAVTSTLMLRRSRGSRLAEDTDADLKKLELK